MHQAIERIIDRLMGAVKTDKPFYTLKDLLSAGFPPFIVERIRININEKLKEEIVFPKTQWADLDISLVVESWQDFQHAVFSNSRIPKDELYELTGNVVSEIVKVYLEPRQHMAEYIYKGEEELDFNELLERTGRLTIYKHFGRAIPLYMQKRKLKTLEKKRCKLLIHNLDAKLVASYTAEDWIKVLELLFILNGGKIHSSLLQYFFEDKGLYLTAKTFNQLNEEVTKQRFIEILSDPDLLNVELQEKVGEKLKEELVAQKDRFDNPDEEELTIIDEKEQKVLDNFLGKFQEEALSDEESLNALFASEKSGKTIFNEFEEAPDSDDIAKTLNKGEKTSDSKRFRENLTGVLDLAASSYKNLSQEEEQEIKSKEKTSEKKKEKTGKKQEAEDAKIIAEETVKDNDEEEKPMWQQFISPEQRDLIMGTKSDEDEDSDPGILVENDEFIDEPVVDIMTDEEEAALPNLRVHLLGQEVFYIEELFGGSESDYEHVLARLAVHDKWESASEYLQKEVFASDFVDMYSDAAIDFTDQLQSFFNDQKK